MGGDELTSPQKGLGLKFFSYEEAEQDTDQQASDKSESFELVGETK